MQNVNVNLMVESLIQIISGKLVKIKSVKKKKHHIFEKDYIWNPPICSCENSKYLASIIGNSVIMCDEIIEVEAKSFDEETKTVPRNFNGKSNL